MALLIKRTIKLPALLSASIFASVKAALLPKSTSE